MHNMVCVVPPSHSPSRYFQHKVGSVDRPLGKRCNDLSVWSLRREVQSMKWPGLLITAPFATVRRNQLCQVFKAKGEAAAHYTDQTHFQFIPQVTSHLQKHWSCSTHFLSAQLILNQSIRRYNENNMKVTAVKKAGQRSVISMRKPTHWFDNEYWE